MDVYTWAAATESSQEPQRGYALRLAVLRD